MRLIHGQYEPSKHKKVTEQDMTRSIVASVIGIVVCLICLIGTTWAWYTDTVTSQVITIQAANYDVDVEVKDGDTTVSSSNGTYTLDPSKTYTVTLKAKGTGKTGFCKVTVDGTEKHTAPIAKNGTLSFTVKNCDSISFQAIWGTYSGTGEIGSNNATVNGNHTPTQSAPMQSALPPKVSAPNPVQSPSPEIKESEQPTQIEETETPENSENPTDTSAE
ncbi:MAG: hypothetical protein Q3985_03085 [Eubacteriales bacterium]|nr:hypothetical protein [Eubacteriales bacterium]